MHQSTANQLQWFKSLLSLRWPPLEDSTQTSTCAQHQSLSLRPNHLDMLLNKVALWCSLLNRSSRSIKCQMDKTSPTWTMDKHLILETKPKTTQAKVREVTIRNLTTRTPNTDMRRRTKILLKYLLQVPTPMPRRNLARRELTTRRTSKRDTSPKRTKRMLTLPLKRRKRSTRTSMPNHEHCLSSDEWVRHELTLIAIYEV